MRFLLLAALGILLAAAGCSRLPPVTLAPGAADTDAWRLCHRVFPQRAWQVFHTISATFPGGRQAVFSGVTLIHPEQGSIRAVLMTLEGMVLFDGEYRNGIVVHRALGPFARPGLARGLLSDVGMMFLAPQAADLQTGWGSAGRPLCRLALAGSAGWLDVTTGPAQGWRLTGYDSRERLVREVTGDAAGPDDPLALAPRITLNAPGPKGYRLTLELVEAVPPTPNPNPEPRSPNPLNPEP